MSRISWEAFGDNGGPGMRMRSRNSGGSPPRSGVSPENVIL